MTKEDEIKLNNRLYSSQGNNNPSLEEVKLMTDVMFKEKAEGSGCNCMPHWRDFKGRRQQLNLSMQDVADCCGCSKSTISRLEKGKEVYYSTVKAIHRFYLSNEVELKTKQTNYGIQ